MEIPDDRCGPSRRLVALFLGTAFIPGRAHAEALPAVTVAAAADLRLALDQIAAAFEKAQGATVRITYGSSGNLARQIAQGAPFELFLSADEALAQRLIDSGHATAPGALYGIGRLALIARKASAIEAEAGLATIPAALTGGAITRFAIANPEHAPYGARAREALQNFGVWDQLQGRLVLAENVAQAAQFVATGAADAGMTALPLVKVGDALATLRFSVVPVEYHTPLRQRMVLAKQAGAPARALYAFIASPGAQAILRTFGFEQP